jgi:hypothetical protein
METKSRIMEIREVSESHNIGFVSELISQIIKFSLGAHENEADGRIRFYHENLRRENRSHFPIPKTEILTVPIPRKIPVSKMSELQV